MNCAFYIRGAVTFNSSDSKIASVMPSCEAKTEIKRRFFKAHEAPKHFTTTIYIKNEAKEHA